MPESRYEVRVATHGHGLRITLRSTGETVNLNGRMLDQMSSVAAQQILGLLERRDALRAERYKRVANGNDLAEILDLQQGYV